MNDMARCGSRTCNHPHPLSTERRDLLTRPTTPIARRIAALEPAPELIPWKPMWLRRLPAKDMTGARG